MSRCLSFYTCSLGYWAKSYLLTCVSNVSRGLGVYSESSYYMSDRADLSFKCFLKSRNTKETKSPYQCCVMFMTNVLMGNTNAETNTVNKLTTR